jgi:beta-lactam-binding protein with PASTA domain
MGPAHLVRRKNGSFEPVMSEPESFIGTVLGGRYRLDAVRDGALSQGALSPGVSAPGDSLKGLSSGAGARALQFEATDLSANEKLSVRLISLQQLIDPALGATTVSDALDQFERQCEVAMGLSHPTIENVLDHGDVTLEGERYVYVVASLLAGGSLRDFIDRGRRLTPSQALVVGIDVCRAMDAAARQGIVHGDLRPSRLIFGLDRRVRVVGFGAPQRSTESWGIDQANYGAPELFEGASRTTSSDVYALALTLVEAMTGTVPFAGDTPDAAAAQRAGKLLPVNADFGALAQVLERAGRPDPAERCTPREFGQALVQAAEKLPRPTPIEVVGESVLFAPSPAPSLGSPPVAERDPIVIRTTPSIAGSEPTPPVAPVTPAPVPKDPSGPLVIGGDETGPTAIDAAVLATLASEDPTAQQQVQKPKRWKMLIGIVLLAVIALFGAGVLAYNTVLNPKNPVPILEGLTEGEARNQVSKYGWKIKVVYERSDEIEKDRVIRSEPPTGVELAKRDTLTLYVAEGPTLSVLTDVTGLTLDEARAQVEALQLVVVTTDIHDEEVPPGSVVSWVVSDQPTLQVGDSLVKGAVVNLNVSIGPAPRTIPDLAGATPEAATEALGQLGLVAAVLPDTVPHPTIALGTVSVMDPVAGSQLPRGATVTLTLSGGQVGTLIPTIINRDIQKVRERLVAAGLIVGTITGNRRQKLVSASIEGRPVKDLDPALVGQTVDLVFP